MSFICQASSETSFALLPWARMEIPVLSSRPGYTRAATHCFPLANTSTTLLSRNTLSRNGSPGSKTSGAVSGARERASDKVDE